MKIAILNTSDAKGGAAIVSHRLLNGLCESGIDARMIVADKTTDNNRVASASSPSKRRSAFLLERLDIFAENGFSRKNLFKVSTARFGSYALSHEWIRQADIVCINWINQGFLSLADIARLHEAGKKIVWTMHDMWCATGICHHAYDCRRYTNRCGQCPFVRFPFRHDLSRQTWNAKKHLYDSVPIQFVAVSNWLAERCKESSLLREKPLAVIHNALPIEHFDWRRAAGAPSEKTVIAMGAARLDDPIKGFGIMVDAVNLIADNHPDMANRLELLLFGFIRDEALLQSIRLNHRWIGAVAPNRIPELLQNADIVLSSSHFETLPTTLIEGQAAGCLAVAFDHGGQRDIIDHQKNGYLAAYPDASDLANGIIWAAEQKADRQAIHDETAARFSEKAIAKQYINLFNSL